MADLMINLAPNTEKSVLYKESYLKKYAEEHKNELVHLRLNNSKDDTQKDIILISNIKGWCTVYFLNTKRIFSGWAGDFAA